MHLTKTWVTVCMHQISLPNELKEDMQLVQYARAIQAWRAVEAIKEGNDRGPFLTYLKGRLADIEYVEKARGSVIDEVRRILGEEDGQMVIPSIYRNNVSGDNTDLKMRGMSDMEIGDHLLQELMRVNVERSENKYISGSSWLENLLVIRQRMMEFKVQVENLLKRYGGLENAVEEEVFL